MELTEEQIKARFTLYAKAGKRSARLQDVEIEDVRFLKFKTIVKIKDAMALANDTTEIQIINAVFQNYDKQYHHAEGSELQVIEFIYFIIDGIKAIANMEKESFDSSGSDDVDTSGLDRFKEINIIDRLADGNILRWNEIQELPYFDVFIKLLMEQEKSKIELSRMKKNT